MSQTQRDIQVMLAAAGISPLKRFGQNFLIDANLMRKLVEAAGITAHDVVLEVGPGTGALTDHLIERAGHVICVEVDRGMQAICLARFGNRGNFTLISGDVLAGKSQISTAVLHAIAHQHALLRGRAMLVSNLPYQVATPLVIELMIGQMIINPLCFTVQAEVGIALFRRPALRRTARSAFWRSFMENSRESPACLQALSGRFLESIRSCFAGIALRTLGFRLRISRRWSGSYTTAFSIDARQCTRVFACC